MFRLIPATLALCFACTYLPAVWALNLARDEMNVDQAWQNYGVSGKDVVVVIIDRGIDYTHPDFITPQGKTRIKWLLDMSGQNNCPGNPAAVEYSEAQINTALSGGTEVPSYDRVGHGTATAGAAAGNGRALPDGRFKGIAPEADIIVIKHTSEGAPAGGGFPAEAGFLSCLIDGFAWLDEKLTALGKPAVAVINSGVQWGPQDGTGKISQLIDTYFGNRPGRIMVIPSGDEGTLPSHAGGEFSADNATVVRFNKTSNAATAISAWYSGNVPAEISIVFDSGASATATPGQSVSKDGINLINYTPGTEFWTWQNTSGDRAVFAGLGSNTGPGEFRIRALGAANTPGRFDVYSDVSGPGLTTVTELLDHLVPGRINDYATTRSALVAADYVVRTSYVDIDGFNRGVMDEGLPGELWLKSGRGPTRDGRNYGVDVALPGEGSFVSLGQQSWWKMDIPSAQPQQGEGWYVRFGGTSGASPLLTGAVALMLEMKPTLTTEQAREILITSARQDAHTGAVPNIEWGFGKVDVNAALSHLEGVPVAPHHSASWFDLSHNGEGWLLEILKPEVHHGDGSSTPGTALAYWFTYPPAGGDGQQSWLIALGSIEGDTITFDEALQPVGGKFGPGFDPADVVLQDWGHFTFRFLGCDSGVMTYQGDGDWGRGFLDLKRLTRLVGLPCGAAAKTQAAAGGSGNQPETSISESLAGISGSWFDPSHDGEGWLIEILSDTLALVYWFTYDSSGKQAWFTGVGDIDGNTISVELLLPKGAEFGPGFDPETVDFVTWGTAEFSYDGCDGGSMTYNSNLAGYGSGSLTLKRLARLAEVSCEQP